MIGLKESTSVTSLYREFSLSLSKALGCKRVHDDRFTGVTFEENASRNALIVNEEYAWVGNPFSAPTTKGELIRFSLCCWSGNARYLSARPHGVLPVGCDDELLKEIADICLIQTVLTLYTARLVGYSYFLKAENLKNCQLTGSRNRNQPVCHYEIYCFFITSRTQFWMAFRFAPFSNLPSCHFRSG